MRWTSVVGLLLCLVSSAVVAGSAFVYTLLHKAVGEVQRVPGLRTTPEEDGKPVTYLVVGSDARDAPQFAADREGPEAVEGQRADVVIAIVLDPRRRAAVLLSIPRDTRVSIAGGGLDKINAAFNEGPQRMVDTVGGFLGMPVNHYIEVGFIGFMRLVDAVGKVPLCNDRALMDEFTGLDLPAGCHDLDGGGALPFVRSRHTLIETDGVFVEDPTGDFGRIQRQQQFLRALFAKAAKPSNALAFPRYVSAVSDTVRADSSFGEGDAVALARRFLKFDPASLFMVSLPGAIPQDIGGVSYVIAGPETDAFLAALRDGRPLPGEPGRPVELADVPVVVFNGSGIAGCAQRIADKLRAAGAVVGEIGTATSGDLKETELRHNPGDRPRADAVRAALGFGHPVERNRPGPEVEVVVGADATKECRS